MKFKNIKKEKKSFFFKDYNEAEFAYYDKANKLSKVSNNRIVFLSFIFFSLIVIICIKIFYLSLFQEKNFYSKSVKSGFIKERADILDKNGIIIARNITIYDAAINPKLVKNKKNLLINLKIIFPKIDITRIEKKLENGNFFYLKRRLTDDEKTKLWLLGNKAIQFPERQFRIYPQKSLFSHVLGQINEDNEGISGIEKYFDEMLTNEKLLNSSFNVTLDSNLQYLIREELINAKENFNTIGGAAVLMDINDGKILSLVSLPDYDLNKRFLIDNNIYTNKITMGVYELGSVFKTFTLAAGIEKKIIKPDTVFKNLESKIKCGKHIISEHDELPKNLNAEEILIRSSNIGAIKIAQKIGKKNYKNFLNSLGLFNKINFELHEIGTPLSFNWGKCRLATISFGHGITTTPLQLARAYAILGNGGFKIEPHILKRKFALSKKKEKIISTKTSDIINSILRKVVSLEIGTANFANVQGYEVGGKTGTALKYKSNEKLNTFVSLFPTSKPTHVLLVMLDEPKSAPNFLYEFPPSDKFPKGYRHKGEKRNTSGWNTVVVTGKIIEKIGPILAINNLQASKNF